MTPATAHARRTGEAPAESAVADLTFPALGTTVRLRGPGAGRARETVLDAGRRLTRFAPSELTALNDDPRAVVPVSDVLHAALAAALGAARATDGLVTPCVLGALEAAGYTRTFADLPEPVAARPAVPAGDHRTITLMPGRVHRPPGLRLDLGGTAKGWLADELADLELADLGGDLRVRGAQDVHVAHPRGGLAARLRLRDEAVATSSTSARAWRGGHHLIDPATGAPARTPLAQVTAIAPTALEAEWRAKATLLTGTPAWLSHGGVVVHHDGRAERIG